MDKKTEKIDYEYKRWIMNWSIENISSVIYKISCVFDKILFLSVICRKCGDNNNRIFKEEETIETLKILGLIEEKFDVYLINMSDKKVSQEFRLKKIYDETRSYFVEEMKQNDLLSKNTKTYTWF